MKARLLCWVYRTYTKVQGCPLQCFLHVSQEAAGGSKRGGSKLVLSGNAPSPFFFLPLASTSAQTSRWSRHECDCNLSESRFSSIFKIFLQIASILVGRKIVKMQLWWTAAGYSLFGRNLKFDVCVFMRHFFNCTHWQSGAKPPIFIGCRLCQGLIKFLYVNYSEICQIQL